MTPSAIELEVAELLVAQAKTLATAESCTGGLIAHVLTNRSGSSRYLLGGVVAYANEIKQRVLGVSEQTLIAYGAVSEQTAREMALGAVRVFGADYALSVTGIAGPTGGTAEKPVGLTYIGLADASGILVVERHIWTHDRLGNKNASAIAALALLAQFLRT